MKRRMPTVREVAHYLFDQQAEAIARRIEPLNVNPSHSEEELLNLPYQTPVRAMKDAALLADYATKQRWSANDTYVVLKAAGLLRTRLAALDIDDTCTMTYGEACELAKQIEVLSVTLHRPNAVMHDLMLRVADMLDDRGRLRFAVKKEHLRSEEAWTAYTQDYSNRFADLTSWYTLQDHLRIYSDAMVAASEHVYEALRNRLIALQWREVELSARIELALRMSRVCQVTYIQFFDDIRREKGIDFRRMFGSFNMQPVTDHFRAMCSQAGFPTAMDATGTPHLKGFEGDESPRVLWAWKKFMADLRDDEKQDQTAQQAIDLNPELAEECQRRIEAEQEEQKQREMEEGFKQLEEKYKVTIQ